MDNSKVIRRVKIYGSIRDSHVIMRKEPKTFPDYGKGNCLYCGEPIPPNRRKYCQDYHGQLYRHAISDKELISWHTFRYRIAKRDNKTCQDCGIYKEDDEELDVHHIIPIHKGGDQWDKSNLITLCHDCHKKRHRKQFQEPSKNQAKLDIMIN